MTRSVVFCAVALLAASGFLPAGAAVKEKTLYVFSDGSDGGYPQAPVSLGSAGSMYGTTNEGGVANNGVVFMLTKSGTESVVHAFEGGTDGCNPANAGVALDSAGDLYGEAPGCARIFALRPDGSFIFNNACQDDSCGGPYGGLFLARDGYLYGTTHDGGTANQHRCGDNNDETCGVVFRLSTDGTVFADLHVFNGGEFGNGDGYHPMWGVIADAKDNLYGTTQNGGGGNGGGDGCGIVFRIAASTGKETILHRFDCSQDGSPSSPLAFGPDGNLYGATDSGASNGEIYRVSKAGKGFAVVHGFGGGNDGVSSNGVVFDKAGNIFGCTYEGGSSGAGTVFEISSNGTETILYNFSGGADGGYPEANLTITRKGVIYGTTHQGGAAGAGTVFTIAGATNK